MNGQRVGSREVKTICWSKVQGALFARRQMGGLVGGDPFNLDQLCFPNECQLRGVGQEGGWQGQICYWRSVSLSTRIPPNGRAGNESGRQLPSTLMMGSYASKFQIIETLIDLLPLQSSLCLMMIGSFGWRALSFCFDCFFVLFLRNQQGACLSSVGIRFSNFSKLPQTWPSHIQYTYTCFDQTNSVQED